jgi:hypothetical protein
MYMSCKQWKGSTNFIISKRKEDKIQSSYLFTQFKSKVESKMTSSKFKDDRLRLIGITYKSMKNGRFFVGLKAGPDIIGPEEH